MTTTNEMTATAGFPVTVPTPVTENTALVATTMEEFNQAIAATERAATDLVATPVVKDGYMAHGHPAEMGFIHLNTMTASRLKKHFPFYDKSEPLFRLLTAQGKLIVGRGLVKKYEARLAGKKFDHMKWINKEFDKLFSNIEEYRVHLKEIEYNDSGK